MIMQTSPHILLVDDEQRFAESLQFILMAEDYPSTIASDGSVALELLIQKNFDLVLLDVDLPGMNGVQLISHIKKLFPILPVIMMTGNAAVETAVEAMKIGAYDYLKKPIDHELLKVTIQKALDYCRLEKELAASEKRFKILSDASREGIVIHDKGLLVEANQQFFDMFGYHKDELFGANILEMFFPGNAYFQVIQTIQEGNFSTLETEGRNNSGSSFPLEIRSNEIEFNGRQVTVSTIRDITERKNAELEKLDLRENLAKASKLEALGLMAGSVAHDLNNILSGIVSYPEILLMDRDLSAKHKKSIHCIQDAGKRAASVVSDLISIARDRATVKIVNKPNAIIYDHLSSLEHIDYIGRFPGISIQLALADDLLNIRCSDIHIKKVLMNLLGNAMEALKDTGSIVISTENIHLEKPLLVYETIAEGNYIKIAISDDGAGISQTDIERIFEPFYSKKVMGRSGTGLGLAIVWNRVHEHDGFINVISGANGTTFEVYIPSTTEAKTTDSPVASLNSLKGDGEVVLVVDDEMAQCLTASNLLKNLGYTPIQTTKGEEAVEMCKNTSVDVVLLDMVLEQGVSGSQIYEQMLHHNQRQKAIVVSGFAEEEEITKIKNLGVSHFVKKPYTVNQLAIAVKQALGNSSGIS